MGTSKKVFIIGELNVDLIMTGENVVPEWNQEKLVDSFDMVLGSSSAITAAGLAGLGLDVYFVSVVGDDTFGHYCMGELEKHGIHTEFIQVDPSLRTGVTLSLSTAKDRALLTYMGSISKVNPHHLSESLFDAADHIHFGSFYLQQEMQNHWIEVFQKAKSKGITTSFDTGWDPEEQWHGEKIKELLSFTDLFIPSEVELENIFHIADFNEIHSILNAGHGKIAIKMGAKGSLLINEDQTELSDEGFKLTPIDTTGAGDSFNAGLIYGYLKGLEKEELLQFANACGAIATQRIGGASSVPSVSDVLDFISKQVNAKSH